ncbi:MAG: hypothetical protein IJP92_03530 [Lachnospiraceae bacterium]|nr:hypothetical protein [Lachnospiraceae bacterium]
MKLLNRYHSGDQFLFQDESIRDEACRILTREHYVVRYFEDGSDYGLYIIVREEAESMLEIPAERLVRHTLSDIKQNEFNQEKMKELKDRPLIFDYDCPPMRFGEDVFPEPDLEKAMQERKHLLDDLDRSIIDLAGK